MTKVGRFSSAQADESADGVVDYSEFLAACALPKLEGMSHDTAVCQRGTTEVELSLSPPDGLCNKTATN